jgi:hypothetical protein
MDLTAAFEELLKREKAGEKDINIATEYPFSAFTREQLEAIKVRSKELPQLWAKSRPRRLFPPQHPICN